MKNVIIIGAGMTGLGTAWKLSENGYQVKILESEKIIGGLAKTVKVGSQNLDIGPHSFFSEDKEILKKVLNLFDDEKGSLNHSKRRKKN